MEGHLRYGDATVFSTPQPSMTMTLVAFEEKWSNGLKRGPMAVVVL